MNNTPPDFLVECGSAESLEEAKKLAINNIRENIAAAISSRVNSQFVQVTSETSNNHSRNWSEEINSTLNVETQLSGTLSGISISLAKDVYWEKFSTKNTTTYRCCLLYEFSKETLKNFIEQNELNRIKIERKKAELLIEYENCNTFSDLQKLKNQVRAQVTANDPLFSKLLESFHLFLIKEIEGIKPNIEHVHAHSINIAFQTTSGKNILTNALYQLNGSTLKKYSTKSNADSIPFINPITEGATIAKIIIEYSLASNKKSEEIYFQPVTVKERIKLNNISTRSLEIDKLIHVQLELLDKEAATIHTILMTGNGVNIELVPLESCSKLKFGINTVSLSSANENSLLELKKKLNRYFDIKVLITNESGKTITKEIYSFLIN